MGIHPSTFYRWRHQAERFGLEILRPRERRQPRIKISPQRGFTGCFAATA
jgi:hypothetical protein